MLPIGGLNAGMRAVIQKISTPDIHLYQLTHVEPNS